MLQDNAPCGTATLLRPAAWVAEEGATPGGTIFLNLPEIGIEGPVEVVSIETVTNEPGPGGLVAGVFRHTSGDILDPQFKVENQPLGTMKPLYSAVVQSGRIGKVGSISQYRPYGGNTHEH